MKFNIGGMNIQLPNIDAEAFSKDFMLRKARRAAIKEVWPFLNSLTAPIFRAAIQENKPFLSTLDVDKFPAKWKEAISQGPQYAPIFAMFSADDLLTLLPPWLVNLVNVEPNGRKWYESELSFIKQIFGR